MRELKEGLLDFAVYARTFLVAFCVFAAIPLGFAAGNYVASKMFDDYAKIQTESVNVVKTYVEPCDAASCIEGEEQ